jgi:hypothetical protein
MIVKVAEAAILPSNGNKMKGVSFTVRQDTPPKIIKIPKVRRRPHLKKFKIHFQIQSKNFFFAIERFSPWTSHETIRQHKTREFDDTRQGFTGVDVQFKTARRHGEAIVQATVHKPREQLNTNDQAKAAV